MFWAAQKIRIQDPLELICSIKNQENRKRKRHSTHKMVLFLFFSAKCWAFAFVGSLYINNKFVDEINSTKSVKKAITLIWYRSEMEKERAISSNRRFLLRLHMKRWIHLIEFNKSTISRLKEAHRFGRFDSWNVFVHCILFWLCSTWYFLIFTHFSLQENGGCLCVNVREKGGERERKRWSEKTLAKNMSSHNIDQRIKIQIGAAAADSCRNTF